MATRASLRGIGRGYKHNQNSCNRRFVADKHLKLIKRPVVRSTSLGFACWLFVKSVTNSAQVFKCQGSITAFSFLYQLLADVVVQPLLKATFSTREPAEQSATAPAAFALNVRPCLAKSIPDRLDLFTTPRLTRGSGSNVSTSKIDSNHFGCFARWWGIYLNHKVDVVIPFLGFTQRCTCEVLPSKQCHLIATNGQLKVNSSTLECHTYNLGFFDISKCADIQANRGGSKLVDLLDSFGVIDHPPNGLANVVGFKSRSFFHGFINLVVKLRCIPAIIAFSHCKYLIASISKSPQSLIDPWSRLYRDYKLAFNRQRLSHNDIIAHPDGRRLKPNPKRSSPVSHTRSFLFSEVS